MMRGREKAWTSGRREGVYIHLRERASMPSLSFEPEVALRRRRPTETRYSQRTQDLIHFSVIVQKDTWVVLGILAPPSHLASKDWSGEVSNSGWSHAALNKPPFSRTYSLHLGCPGSFGGNMCLGYSVPVPMCRFL